MTSAGRSIGVAVGILLVAAATAQVPPAPAPIGGTGGGSAGLMPGPMAGTAPGRIVLADVVDPAFKDAVLAVARKPTLSTRYAAEEVACPPDLYAWLLEHPDRVSLAWQRLKIPCVVITDAGNGKFAWTDDGSEVVWQTVGRFPEGVVWYATGKVKPSPVTPTVPVKAVVVVTFVQKPAANGATTIVPAAQAFVVTDSKAANTVMRMLGPTGPKLAEQGAEQLLFFFSGIAKYLQAHPGKADELLAPAKE